MFRWYQMTGIWPGAIMYHVYDQVPLVPSIWPLATRQVPPWHDSHVKCVAARCRHTRRHIRAPPPVILGMKWISRGAPSHQLDTKCPIISHILDTKYITHQIYLKQCICQQIFSKNISDTKCIWHSALVAISHECWYIVTLIIALQCHFKWRNTFCLFWFSVLKSNKRLNFLGEVSDMTVIQTSSVSFF